MKNYRKPNMTNLQGEIGEKILAEIRNSKIPNHDNLRKSVREQKKLILAERDK